MLRVRTAGVRPWCHTDQSHLPHHALDPFAIDSMAETLKENNHFTATIERMPVVFLVDQATEQHVAFI